MHAANRLVGQTSYYHSMYPPISLSSSSASVFLSTPPSSNLKASRVMTRKPCCDKGDADKGAWSKQEDQKLIDYIRQHGEGCWAAVPRGAGLLRCGKNCRLRWINHLRPNVKRGKFAEDEEDLIIKLHALLGNRWSLISGRLPGRTENEIKKYWNSHLGKKLLMMGVDPNNHRPVHGILRSPAPAMAQVPSNVSSTATSPSFNVQLALPSPSVKSSRGNYNVEEDQDYGRSPCRKGRVPDLNLDLTMN
ncbi:hypothetical protein SAY87_020039 [Trapa incisa]|uniref:Uncharacterized protein n=1 Tax=Trapa incisa TaxID=236973 RepID=A0AAN7K6R5_9MYRT|nr:hypothetical protein SAY87_020039 [Trapa incisa]